MSNMTSQKCSVDLYDGAYGRTLRIEIPSSDHLSFFKNLLIQVSSSTQELRLETLNEFVLTGVRSVVLMCHLGKPSDKTVNFSSSDTVVTWVASPSQWVLCVNLLNGFEADCAAHHYLSREGTDDVLIEVSYLGG